MTEDPYGREPDPRSACSRKRRTGRYCGRASCCTECHLIYMLRVREYLKLLLKEWPSLRPTLLVRVRLEGASFGLYRRFRREFTRRLSRRKIEYALVTHLLEGNPHDHGFIREGTRDQVLSAIRGAAEKVGYELGTDDYAVTPFTNLEGMVTYVTAMEKVEDAAPKRWRVFTASFNFSPLGFRNGQLVDLKRKLGKAERIHPKMLSGLQERLEKNWARYEKKYGVNPRDLARR